MAVVVGPTLSVPYEWVQPATDNTPASRQRGWIQIPARSLSVTATLAPERRRRGLGVEPMTCPPNAFSSGEQLIRLEPGESATAVWGARLAA